MTRRAIGGVLAAGALVALVGVLPVVADAASGTVATTGVEDAATASLVTTDTPIDSGPLVLLLIAGGIGSMGLLSREPAPAGSRTRR